MVWNSSILMDELASCLGIYASGPNRPWLWIIEYLSSFSEIDSSIITSLIQEAPLLPDEIDERTNERVALGCLVKIFGFKQGLTNVAPPNSRTFDLSLSCQDVLYQIQKEVPLSTLIKAGPELLKWDMWPFIIHKRGTLPKCKLEELKESYMEKNHAIDGNGESSSQEDSLTHPRIKEDNGESGNQEGNLTPQRTTRDDEDFKDRLFGNVMMVESNNDENAMLQTSPGADAGEKIDQGCQLSSPSSTSSGGFQQNIDHDMAEADMDHSFAEQLCENEDEVFNITLKKNISLSLQYRSRQQNLCVKCNQDGQLLACSSSDCPIMVHEGCSELEASFDDKGHFYCPFCACSLFIPEYLEAKEKCSLAGKKLAEFMNVFPKNLEELRMLKSHSRFNGNDEYVGIQESGHLEWGEQNFISRIAEVKHGPASCLNGPKVCKPIDDDLPVNPAEAVRDTMKGPAFSLNGDGFESLTNADDEIITSRDTRKSRKQKAMNSSLPVPQLRRMKLRWREEEEEMLREVVPKFKAKGLNIPWKLILQSGSRIFQTRTPADLKDKWKRMCGKDKGSDLVGTELYDHFLCTN